MQKCIEPEIVSLQSLKAESIYYDMNKVFEYHALKRQVNKILARLTPREERILRLRYFLNIPVKEIAELFGLSSCRIYAIEQMAFRKLKHLIFVRQMKDFIKVNITDDGIKVEFIL